jgi:uncharacterized protein YggE
MLSTRPAAAMSAALLVAALSSPAAAQDAAIPPESGAPGQRPSFVSVEGRGLAFGEPDVATLELGVTASDLDVRAAVARLDEGIAGVTDALRALGIEDRAIRTISYDIWREEHFPQDDGGSAKITFRAQHLLRVELEGARRAGEALAVAVEAGANAVGGIVFGFSDPTDLERRARAAAVADARARAEQLASAAGATLGPPLAIRELSDHPRPFQTFERSAAVSGAAPIETGELSVEIRVAIDYRLDSP